jgi:ADP-heptose:LPS heptosyltransferase
VAFFAKVMEAISKNGEVSFWVLGGPSEKAAGEKLMELLPDLDIETKAGKLSLPASMEHLGTANLLISNESSPVHMAATTGTPCVCISQGNHFGRWNPYPKEIAPGIITVYPPSFGNVGEAYDALALKFHDGSTEDVSEIGWEQVYNSSMHLLRGQGYFPSQAVN